MNVLFMCLFWNSDIFSFLCINHLSTFSFVTIKLVYYTAHGTGKYSTHLVCTNYVSYCSVIVLFQPYIFQVLSCDVQPHQKSHITRCLFCCHTLFYKMDTTAEKSKLIDIRQIHTLQPLLVLQRFSAIWVILLRSESNPKVNPNLSSKVFVIYIHI